MSDSKPSHPKSPTTDFNSHVDPNQVVLTYPHGLVQQSVFLWTDAMS